MNRSHGRESNAAGSGGASRKVIRRAATGFLAVGLAAGLSAPAAQAQFLRSWAWHADEGPPPVPPGDVGPRAARWHVVVPHAEYDSFSLAEARRRAKLLGLRLVATPHRKGHLYVVFAEDTHGLLHHLAFEAHGGTLVENVTSEITLKPGAGHAAAGNPPAAAVQVPSQAKATPAPSAPEKSAAKTALASPAKSAVAKPALTKSALAKPALAKPALGGPGSAKPDTVPASVTARELSPIRPQPGTRTGQDGEIDKD